MAPLADSIDVNVASRRARDVVWRQQQTPLSEILRAIAALKYLPRPVPLDALAGIDLRQRRSALWRMLVALLCMMQAMMYAVPRYIAGEEMPGEIVRLLVWAELLLTHTGADLRAGPFFQGAWRDLRAQADRHGHAGRARDRGRVRRQRCSPSAAARTCTSIR